MKKTKQTQKRNKKNLNKSNKKNLNKSNKKNLKKSLRGGANKRVLRKNNKSNKNKNNRKLRTMKGGDTEQLNSDLQTLFESQSYLEATPTERYRKFIDVNFNVFHNTDVENLKLKNCIENIKNYLKLQEVEGEENTVTDCINYFIEITKEEGKDEEKLLLFNVVGNLYEIFHTFDDRTSSNWGNEGGAKNEEEAENEEEAKRRLRFFIENINNQEDMDQYLRAYGL